MEHKLVRAVVCRTLGSPASLSVEELPRPVPAANEVLVRIKAAAVNFVDLLMIAGRYQVKPPLPFVAGQEFSGEVIEVGSHVTQLRVGDRVMGSPANGGGFAELIAIPAKRLWKIPEGFSFDAAAGLLIAHGTAYFGLRERTLVAPGEWLVVSGAAGGVGLAAVEVGKRLGLRVIAAAGSQRKLDVTRAHGADAVVNYAIEDLRARVKEITGGRGYDVFFDTVGGDVFDAALHAAATGARLLVVGFAGGRIPSIAANYLLLRNISAVGVGFGGMVVTNPEVVQRVIDGLAALHRAQPFDFEVGGVFELESASQALEQLASRSVAGRLLVRP